MSDAWNDIILDAGNTGKVQEEGGGRKEEGGRGNEEKEERGRGRGRGRGMMMIIMMMMTMMMTMMMVMVMTTMMIIRHHSSSLQRIWLLLRSTDASPKVQEARLCLRPCFLPSNKLK